MAPPVKELTRPPLQRRPNDPPRAAPMLAEDGTQLQVRISELEPATDVQDVDQLEVSQAGKSRKMSVQLLKTTTAQDLSRFLTGIVPGDGIQVLGGAPAPTVKLEEHGAPGTFGDATHVPQIEVDTFGRVNSVTLVPIAQPDVSGFAPIASPTFTGDPKAPTAAPGDSDTSVATTAFVQGAINSRGFAPIANPAFTGNPTAPTPAPGDNDTSIATTAFVEARVAGITPVDLSGYAPIASPTFTGTPKAPTPPTIDSTTNIATTAFVKANVAGLAPLADPAFTGNPTAPTPAVDDNDTSIATTEFVTRALAALGGGGDASISVGTTPPVDPSPNQLWFNSDSRVGQMFIYYDDGNSQAWVPTSPSVGYVSPGGDFAAAGVSPLNRNVWTALYNLSVISGNSGGWYVPATGRYTPPPGRYFIFATFSGTGDSASNQCLTIRKNGVNLTHSQDTSSQGTWYSTPVTAVVVDANGYDWFDAAGYAGAGTQSMVGMSMVAFPLSGIKGPPGDIGSPVASFNVRATGNDTVNSNVIPLFRTIATPVKDYDPDNVWDLANARFTAPSPGRYAFQVSAFLQNNAANFANVAIQHQTPAGAVIRNYGSGSQADQNNYGADFQVSTEFQMATGDRVQFVFSSNAGACSALGVVSSTYLSTSCTYASGRKVV